MAMTVGDLRKRLEHFEDDKKVFIHDGTAVECYSALRMTGYHPDSVILMTLEQMENIKVRSRKK